MDDLQSAILMHETQVPRRYLECMETAEYRVFRDKSNPDSACSNYAVLKSRHDVQASFAAVEAFLEKAGAVPKFASRPDSLPISELAYLFAAHGYAVKADTAVQMHLCLQNAAIAAPVHQTAVSQVLQGAQRELALFQDEGAEYGVRLLDKQLGAGAVLLHAYEGKRPVAMCLAEGHKDILYLSDVYTHPDYRRRGYARAVMQAALTYANAQGYRWAYLYAAGAHARALYANLGFAAREISHFWAYAGALPAWMA